MGFIEERKKALERVDMFRWAVSQLLLIFLIFFIIVFIEIATGIWFNSNIVALISIIGSMVIHYLFLPKLNGIKKKEFRDGKV